MKGFCDYYLYKSSFRYPWESAQTGVEVTPDCCPETRENQQHISGDISFALRSYMAMTQNFTWLKRPQPNNLPIDMAVNIAKFWESRPTFNETKGKWEINGMYKSICSMLYASFKFKFQPIFFTTDIMPPDEYQGHISNSIYTNLIANYAVSTAKWLACLVDEGKNKF